MYRAGGGGLPNQTLASALPEEAASFLLKMLVNIRSTAVRSLYVMACWRGQRREVEKELEPRLYLVLRAFFVR